MLRDGNRTPEDSWREKSATKPPTFELTLEKPLDHIRNEEILSALEKAAASASTYAHLHFHYDSPAAVFIRCDKLLDEVFAPLRRMGIIGCAIPPYEDDPKKGTWLVELYPIEVVPEEKRGILTPGELFRLLAASIADTKLSPPKGSH